MPDSSLLSRALFRTWLLVLAFSACAGTEGGPEDATEDGAEIQPDPDTAVDDSREMDGGVEEQPPDATPDETSEPELPSCIEQPGPQSPDPPVEQCNSMDWKMSSDGYYLISQFGTTQDDTTFGKTTSCGYLQGHYDYNGCIYDVSTSSCLPGAHDIPWVQGNVDYDYDTVIAAVDANMSGDVPFPEYFYVACAQRFNCGSLLRVTNTENGRCVVVYTEDGGPGSTYEGEGYGGRRILDSSPAVVRYLQAAHVGWLNSTLLYVEWGLSDDVPGMACTRCESTPAAEGYPMGGTPFDVQHMMSLQCRQGECGDGACSPGESHDTCPSDCPACEPVPAAGRIIDETDPCFTAGGTPGYWHTESAGYGGSLLWTNTTDSASVDNYGIWQLEIEQAGAYTVEVYTAAAFAQSRLASYQVAHSGTTERVVVDQTAVDGWNTIGTFTFAAGGSQSIRLDDNTGEPYADRVQIVFDAVRIAP